MIDKALSQIIKQIADAEAAERCSLRINEIYAARCETSPDLVVYVEAVGQRCDYTFYAGIALSEQPDDAVLGAIEAEIREQLIRGSGTVHCAKPNPSHRAQPGARAREQGFSRRCGRNRNFRRLESRFATFRVRRNGRLLVFDSQYYRHGGASKPAIGLPPERAAGSFAKIG